MNSATPDNTTRPGRKRQFTKHTAMPTCAGRLAPTRCFLSRIAANIKSWSDSNSYAPIRRKHRPAMVQPHARGGLAHFVPHMRSACCTKNNCGQLIFEALDTATSTGTCRLGESSNTCKSQPLPPDFLGFWALDFGLSAMEFGFVATKKKSRYIRVLAS